MNVDFTQHALDVIVERAIRASWIADTLDKPGRTEDAEDGTTHYLRKIADFGGRVLRVVVNMSKKPPVVVTVFFDRRMKGKLK